MMLTEHLKTMKIKKKELAYIMGVAPATVSRWGEHPPKYVWSYLSERAKVAQAEEKVQHVIYRMDDLLSEMK
jgi:hypothetical protein